MGLKAYTFEDKATLLAFDGFIRDLQDLFNNTMEEDIMRAVVVFLMENGFGAAVAAQFESLVDQIHDKKVCSCPS